MATHAQGQEELIQCGRHNSNSRFGTQLFSITSVVLVYIVKQAACLSRAVISLQANNYNSANRFLKANYFCPITAPLLPAGGWKANISKARGEAHIIGFQVSCKSFYQISNEFDYDAQQESCSTKYNLMCKKLTQPPVKVAEIISSGSLPPQDQYCPAHQFKLCPNQLSLHQHSKFPIGIAIAIAVSN